MSSAASLAVSPRVLYSVTLLLSCCSILYEFLLAQSMAATMGSTFLRYNLTIGFYLASLGFGAMLCSRSSAEKSIERLIDVELAITWVGVLAPFLIILWDSLVYKASAVLGIAFRGWLYQALLYVFNHSLIVAVGLLSGFELPLLMTLGGFADRDRSNDVLALDYFGTVFGAVAFPLLLLPGLGVINTAILTALTNALCGTYLYLFYGRRSQPSRMAGYFVAVLFCLAMLLNTEILHGSFLELAYFPLTG